MCAASVVTVCRVLLAAAATSVCLVALAGDKALGDEGGLSKKLVSPRSSRVGVG